MGLGPFFSLSSFVFCFFSFHSHPFALSVSFLLLLKTYRCQTILTLLSILSLSSSLSILQVCTFGWIICFGLCFQYILLWFFNGDGALSKLLMLTSGFCIQVPFVLNSVVSWFGVSTNFFVHDSQNFVSNWTIFVPNFYYPFLLLSLLLCNLLGGSGCLLYFLWGSSKSISGVWCSLLLLQSWCWVFGSIQ